MNAVISLTTIPDRIDHIAPTVTSLLAQGLPVYVWAVTKIERSGTRLERVPDWLNRSAARVEVVADCGPITKLLPALRRFDTVITADDDCIYGPGWAKTLLEWRERLPGVALGYRGRVLTGKGYTGTRLIQHRRIDAAHWVDIITGVYGGLYERAMFDDGIYEEWRAWPTNDDLVIAAHLKRRGVTSCIVPWAGRVAQTETQNRTPLYRVNRRKGDRRNDRGLRVLGLEGHE